MVDVFISYSRRDSDMVALIARAIEAEGYAVWWDADIAPHQSYGEVITAKIAAAKAVLVVWSADAAASEWVRAEADMARNHRKLIQTALNGVTPPLPFNQIQFAKLDGWQGEADHPGWRMVKQSLAHLCGPVGTRGEHIAEATHRPAPPSPPPAVPVNPVPPSRWPLFAGIGIGVLALAAAGGFVWSQRAVTPPPVTSATVDLPTAVPAPQPAIQPEAAPPAAPGPDPAPPVDEDGVPIEPDPADMTIADSSTRLITPSEIANMGPSTLKVARNEIFARKGRRFNDPWLRDWFSRYAWYSPRFDEVPLNPIEQKNVALLRQAEARFGG